MGVHCLGPYLLTDLLEESLKYTARLPDVGIGETRVVWVGSSGAMLTPKGGVDVEELRNGKFHDHPPTTRYCISKAGEYFLSGKFNRILKDHGVLSVVSFFPLAVRMEAECSVFEWTKKTNSN